MRVSGSEDFWQQVASHTFSRVSLGSPWSVQLQFAALVGDHGVVASWTGYVADGPSVWTVVAVTDDDRLLRLQMEFDAAQYDRDLEQRFNREHNYLVPVLRDTSSRRLRDAHTLLIGQTQQSVDSFGRPLSDQVSVRHVRLLFDDGSDVDLGIDQPDIRDAGDRARSDELLDAIRSRTGL